MLPAGKHGGRALCPPAGQAREAITAVADQREVVRDARRFDSELADDPGLVVGDATHPVAEDDAVPVDELPEVLVDRADDDLLDLRAGAEAIDSGGDGVIGLVLDHRPYRHAEG